jgi:hypothetical protein
MIYLRISSCFNESSSVRFFRAAVVVVMSRVLDSTFPIWSASAYYFSYMRFSTLRKIGSRLTDDLLSVGGGRGVFGFFAASTSERIRPSILFSAEPSLFRLALSARSSKDCLDLASDCEIASS